MFLVEVATLSQQNGKCVTRILPSDEVQGLINAYEKSEAEAAALKKEKAPKSWKTLILFYNFFYLHITFNIRK